MELKNFDKLVRSITSNILEKLEIETDDTFYDKSCLVLPTNGLGMKDYYTYITKEYPEYNLFVGKNKSTAKTQYGNNKLIRYIDIDLANDDFLSTVETVERIIVTGLKISQMKTLIEADDNDDINHLILGSLMANKPVTVLINTNRSMYQKIRSVVKSIKSMGIDVINIQQWNTVSSKPVQSTELITEDYVRKLGQSGSKQIVLSKKQLITPLAKDKLRELRIDIKYVKEDN